MIVPRTARTRVPGAWSGLPAATQDVVLAAVAAVLPVLFLLLDDRGTAAGPRLVVIVLTLLTCASLAFRRRFPLGSAAIAAGASIGAAVVGHFTAATLIVVLAMASAAYHADGRRIPLTIGALVWATTFAVLGGAPPDLYSMATTAALALAPIAFGYALRVQAERGEDAARLERVRAEAARSEERIRIARDVHDVVGHHLSAIRLQAVGGRRKLAGTNTAADHAFLTIGELAHRALGDIRQLLDQLRTDAAPVHGLADLPALVTRLGGDVLRVDLVADALPTGRAPEVETTVYRVVQESLTNVVQHSTAPSATVRITGTAGQLVVTIDDAGPARTGEPNRAGKGLVGMHERVAELGATMEAGPAAPHGWRVRAAFPLDGPS